MSEVRIVGPNRAPAPNLVHAELTADPQTVPFTLDVTRPPSTWTGTALAVGAAVRSSSSGR